MATPVKPTPVLKGEDAKRFEKQIENVKPISHEEHDRAMNTYKKIMERSNLGY